MPAVTIYERFVHILEEREQEHFRHLATLALLRSIKSGEVSIDDVELDAEDNSWRVVPTALPLPPYPERVPEPDDVETKPNSEE